MNSAKDNRNGRKNFFYPFGDPKREFPAVCHTAYSHKILLEQRNLFYYAQKKTRVFNKLGRQWSDDLRKTVY